jgi:hypothetical protein
MYPAPTSVVERLRWHLVGRALKRVLLWTATSLGTVGCLERPVVDIDPLSSNVFVTQVPINSVSAIDLLFVIDNSTSMADKQSLLKKAVPQMVERLVAPDCVTRQDDGEVRTRTPSSPSAAGDPYCPSGGELEFNPVRDMHIGVITSSLGSHGRAELCDTLDSKIEPKTGLPAGQDKNDHAHLIPLVRLPDGPSGPNGEAPVYTGLAASEPFLSWAGQADVDGFGAKFANHVAAAGETGCGFEAPLEAFYRFLIDPHPPASLSLVEGKATPSTAVDPTALDTDLLSQRAQFLRPTSLVAIVVLTDENDCSVLDGGDYYPNAKYGYLALPAVDQLSGGTVRMARPTSVCETNPNGLCCDTCGRDAPRAGCEAEFAASCTPNSTDAGVALGAAEDSNLVRCFDQQRRFGVDLLYPVERYIDGLTRPTIVDSVRGVEARNPLLISESGVARPTDTVYFAGIVGVPWQDIATPESLHDDDELSYLRGEELDKRVEGQEYTRWDVILGRPSHHELSRFCRNSPTDPSCGVRPIPPLDPFMIESIAARQVGLENPIVPAEKITAPGQWNNINGSEQVNTEDANTRNHADDLQYACIFPLADYGAHKDAEKCKEDGAACDCDGIGLVKERSLCRATPTSPLEEAQYWGKAYPGLRILQVLKGLRPANAIVASICPKVSVEGPSFGYNPAVTAIVDRFVDDLNDKCLPRQLALTPGSEEVPCVAVETRPKSNDYPDKIDCTSGNNPHGGRRPVDSAVERVVLDELVRAGVCYRDDTPLAKRKGPIPCSDYSMCEIQQLAGDDAQDCLSGSPTASEAGYCYVDPDQGLGDPALVATCAPNEKRRLRFVSNSGQDPVPTPMNATRLFIACIGSSSTAQNSAKNGEGAP